MFFIENSREYLLAWFSDVRGHSRSLCFSPSPLERETGKWRDLGRLRIRLSIYLLESILNSPPISSCSLPFWGLSNMIPHLKVTIKHSDTKLGIPVHDGEPTTFSGQRSYTKEVVHCVRLTPSFYRNRK